MVLSFPPLLSMPPLLSKPQQLGQAGGGAASAQKFMPAQLLGRGTALDIDAQADAQKALEFLAQLLRLLEPGRAVGGDEVQRLERLLVQVRRLRLNHLNRHDAERPNVDFAAVFLLLDHLGRHPVRCADHGCAFGALFRQLGAEAEIGDFDIAARAEQYVVGFDVSVDDVLCVEVDESFTCLFLSERQNISTCSQICVLCMMLDRTGEWYKKGGGKKGKRKRKNLTS